MIACLDVAYEDTRAVAAGIVFRDWLDETVVAERTVSLTDIQPYQSGRFFLRELPCLQAALQVLPPVQVVVIDGYTFLEGDHPGLGAYLYRSLDARLPVIGVAKTRYRGVQNVQEVTRGNSKRPLYISAAGWSLPLAVERIRSMRGPDRIPLMLKRVDRLSRSGGATFVSAPRPVLTPDNS